MNRPTLIAVRVAQLLLMLACGWLVYDQLVRA